MRLTERDVAHEDTATLTRRHLEGVTEGRSIQKYAMGSSNSQVIV